MNVDVLALSLSYALLSQGQAVPFHGPGMDDGVSCGWMDAG